MDLAFSLQGIGPFLAYFAAALIAEAIFVVLYMMLTPHHEAKLILAGNTAAAISLGGAVLGFTIPLASAITNSVSLPDMAVWSAVALIVQLGVFLLLSVLFRGLSRRIEEGNVAAAIIAASTSLAIGMLNGASMTY